MDANCGRIVIFVFAAVLIPGRPARADGPEPAGPGAEPRRLLEQVRAAYKALHAYEDHGQLSVELAWVPAKRTGKSYTSTAPCRLALESPHNLAVTLGTLRLYGNGREFVTVIDSLKRYMAVPAPNTIGLDVFDRGLTHELLFGDMMNCTHLAVLLTLLFSDDAVEALLSNFGGSVVAADDREIDGASCRCLVLSKPEKGQRSLLSMDKLPKVRLFVDREKMLLRAIEMEEARPRVLFSPILIDPPIELPPGVEVAAVPALPVSGEVLVPFRWTWRSGAITTTPLKSRVFAFDPPEGYTKARSEDELLAIPPPTPPDVPAAPPPAAAKPNALSKARTTEAQVARP